MILSENRSTLFGIMRYGEERIQSLCMDRENVLFVVTVMPDENICRIISALKATRHEQEQYHQGGSLLS